MNNKITDDPIVKALLEHLADSRGKDDPLRELSQELLRGELATADLLRIGWYGEGLATAAEAGQTELTRMAPDQLAKLEEAAARLREVHDLTGRDDS